MRMNLIKGASAALLAVASISTAGASVVEFADPCVKARREFREQSSSVRRQFVEAASQVTGSPTNGEKTELWKELSGDLRKVFDADVAPELRKSGVSPTEEHFRQWMGAQVESEGGSAKVEQIMVDAYRKAVAEAIEKERRAVDGAISGQRKELDENCRMDAGNTMVRVGLRAATAPFAALGRNLELAKRERTVVGKVLAPTGISWDGILKCGPAGCKNSEVRKAGRAIAKVFGW